MRAAICGKLATNAVRMAQAASRTPRVALALLDFGTIRFAGHSKWAKIQRSKGANDAARAIVFSKLSKSISAAVKAGGSSPDSNLRLAAALEAAKRANCPKDIINRAMTSKDGVSLTETTYEAVTSGGVSMLISTLTDNQRRTLQEVRYLITKRGGEMTPQGSQAWNFATKGRVRVNLAADVVGNGEARAAFEEKLMAAALDAGASDVEMPAEDEAQAEDGGEPVATVWCEKDSIGAVRDALVAAGLSVSSAAPIQVPVNFASVPEGDAEETFRGLLEALEEHEDVQEVIHNAAEAEE